MMIKCVDMGVDGIKTEAQLSKDGIIILRFYPFTIIDGKKIRINDLNLKEIKQIKLENDESIPTLYEMFEEFKDRIRYNFDIRDVKTGSKIIDLALDYDLLEKVEITRPVGYTKRDIFRNRAADRTVLCHNAPT